MKHALIAIGIFLVAMFVSAGVLRLADIPAVIFGAVIAGIYLVAALTRGRRAEPPAPPSA